MNRLEQPVDPEPILKRVVKVELGHRRTIPRHQHWDFEFIHLRAGTYEYQHNDLRLRLRPGQCLLLRPGDWHVDYLEADTLYVAVNFILKNPACSLLREKIAGLPAFADVNGGIAGITDRLLEENLTADVFSQHLRDACLRELYWRILRLLPREAVSEELFRSEEDEKLVRELRRIAVQNLQQSLRLEELAAQLHVSPRTLNNRCRDVLGVSPLRACMKIRMEHALEFLNRTSMSVKEISDYLGFRNQYHFSKAFKRFFAVSPSEIRPKGR